MKLYELMDNFCNLCFVKVTEGKLTSDGFEFTYDGGTYDSCIREFIDNINKNELVDKKIIDYLVGTKDNELVIHFYDCDYFSPAKKKQIAKEQQEQEKIFGGKLPF